MSRVVRFIRGPRRRTSRQISIFIERIEIVDERTANCHCRINGAEYKFRHVMRKGRMAGRFVLVSWQRRGPAPTYERNRQIRREVTSAVKAERRRLTDAKQPWLVGLFA